MSPLNITVEGDVIRVDGIEVAKIAPSTAAWPSLVEDFTRRIQNLPIRTASYYEGLKAGEAHGYSKGYRAAKGGLPYMPPED